MYPKTTLLEKGHTYCLKIVCPQNMFQIIKIKSNENAYTSKSSINNYFANIEDIVKFI